MLKQCQFYPVTCLEDWPITRGWYKFCSIWPLGDTPALLPEYFF